MRSTEDAEVYDEQTFTTTTVTRRVWCLQFPSLDDCRDAFEAALKQEFPWGEPRERSDDGEGDDVT
ncbi:MAG: hypothetical protein U1E20_00760 [Methylocystis sp.]|uniref:hypothetical protein n=1 Tax=Methylocystis sp. TaxID=1911079 RepID=UPI0039523C69